MSRKYVIGVIMAAMACVTIYSFTGSVETTVVTESERIEQGKYIVETFGCAHCHTPKKMTDRGPVIDESQWLMGHPADSEIPTIEKSEIFSRGWTYSNMDHTAHVGPWGISYGANITSDVTGIGAWSLDHFKKSLSQGKHKGMDNGRPVMPPMPWTDYVHMSDNDIESLFLYLKSTKPIRNIVPAYTPIDQIQ
ncbi:MAG: diheme cytochrome c-553 [Saprospiraceae bacterium]|nr:diheme cytochrome c-553 [Saprospiraceae bacterium]